jgi:Protein of unknown function (DUF1588)/Protein of unknown function (DUF1592)/Protein of unknown function (DUF1595)/Protein of unknown function (DUF1585)/Protein of unknown function (DUF1587)
MTPRFRSRFVFVFVTAAFCGGCTGTITGSGRSPTGGSPAGSAGSGVPGTPGGPATPTGAGGVSGLTGVGGVGVPGGPGGPAASCTGAATQTVLPAVRIRRLTRLEIQNTLADLLGASAAPLAAGLEPDSQALGYSTGDQRGVSPAYVDALKTMAEGVSALFRTTVVQPAFGAACFASDAGARLCADTFIRDFAKRSFRRPLDEREVTALLGVYDAGRATGIDADVGDRFRSGLDYTVRGVLQSPHFIFRTELGPVSTTVAPTQLTPFELASALSYGTIASPPDAMLLAAAAANQLATPAQIGAQVRRLIAARPDRFKILVGRFALEWLSIDYDKPAWNKDTTVYPMFQSGMKAAFQQETQMFLDDWVDAGSALPALLTGGSGFVSKVNAPVYGLTSTATSLQKTALDPAQRAGILTQPSFLGSTSHIDGSSPVFRGLAIMSRLLCNTPPPVPAMVPPLPPVDKTVIKTTRQRFEQHTTAAFCAGCHSHFDPMGYVFENYDAIGAWRAQENGVAVDASGAIVGTQMSDGPMANAVQMAKALAASPEVHACFARQVFRFDLGRTEGSDDECAIQQYTKAFTDGKLDLRELLVAIATSPGYAARMSVVGGGP